jgi:hypothetical protein
MNVGNSIPALSSILEIYTDDTSVGLSFRSNFTGMLLVCPYGWAKLLMSREPNAQVRDVISSQGSAVLQFRWNVTCSPPDQLSPQTGRCILQEARLQGRDQALSTYAIGISSHPGRNIQEAFIRTRHTTLLIQPCMGC